MNSLETWAEETINLITPYAEKLNLDFYPLQSPADLNCNPKVLFLGLNPGGGATYESQKMSPDWEFVNGKMTVQRLLKGNPFFNKASGWPLIKGLRRINLFQEVLQSDSYLLANYYYLSTSDFKQVQSDPDHKEALRKCKEQTLKLINILKPELIIVLGTSSGIDQLPFNNNKTLLKGYYQRLIVSAEFENIKVCAIPHPSTMAITHDEANAINQNLTEFCCQKELTEYHFSPIDYDSFSMEVLNMKLRDNDIDIQFDEVKKDEFTTTLPYKNNKLLLKIVKKKNEKYFVLETLIKSLKFIVSYIKQIKRCIIRIDIIVTAE